MPHRYAIRHITQFAYDATVSESVMEVRMQPQTSEHQQCLEFAIDVHPRARVFAYRDSLGNWVHHFNVPRRHRQLMIASRAYVEVDDAPQLPPALDATAWAEVESWVKDSAYWDFRQPSQFARTTDGLLAFLTSRQIGDRGRDPLTTARQVMSVLYESFDYVPNSTRVDSPIDHAIEGRAGVCQDFAHLMIATLRHLSLPARYVSGYMAPGGPDARAASVATHAWVEACLPRLGWIGFDPTHNIATGPRHVRVAVGRDYADVPPTRGVFKGSARSALTVAVHISESDRMASPAQEADVRAIGSSPFAGGIDESHVHQQQQQQQ
jgi:transglutaminase-like putative cysteine protease